MRYVSTRGQAPPLGFDDVLIEGLAADGGLYVPEVWPSLSGPPVGSYVEVAEAVVAPFMAGSSIGTALRPLIAETYAGFRHPEVAPLRRIDDRLYLLELSWGPTLSFKDYALQLVGRLFDAVLGERDQRALILGATSGDTGSAAIEACRDRTALDVVILFPEGRVTEFQRRQMTTVASANVHAVSVQGTFDDCQDLVKAAFADPHLRRDLRLAAVNSINWARVMAQAVYYAWVDSCLGRSFSVAVPTGNFGNVFAAYVARLMGVRIERFMVANNANHGLADLIDSGRLTLGEVVPTVAPAMDIAVPSNLERLLFELWDRDGFRTGEALRAFRDSGLLVLDEVAHRRMTDLFSACWLGDGEIEAVIDRVFRKEGFLIDPHTATAWAAAESTDTASPTVVVSTAHPVKFAEAVERAVGAPASPPDDLADLMERPERCQAISGDLDSLRRLLVSVASGS